MAPKTTPKKEPVEVRFVNPAGEVVHRETRWYRLYKTRAGGEQVHSHRARYPILRFEGDPNRVIIKPAHPDVLRALDVAKQTGLQSVAIVATTPEGTEISRTEIQYPLPLPASVGIEEVAETLALALNDPL